MSRIGVRSEREKLIFWQVLVINQALNNGGVEGIRIGVIFECRTLLGLQPNKSIRRATLRLASANLITGVDY